ncbi:choline dehydrogenase [Thiotrichales bacterium 19X7-9]|nr:choline dehydrogenase [Thiotrichales bacterium 19X7-9]
MIQNNQPFDYIIIGAGSAGCVLANRLSKNPSNRVLLLEYGGHNKSLLIDMPSALSYPMNMPKYNWGFYSEKEPYLNNRRMNTPRGKGLGGSSAVNGMVYVRGHANDFNQWQQLGAKNWGYAHCLPYFRYAEHWFAQEDIYRGKQGPLYVKQGDNLNKNPLYQAFIQAGTQAGYSYTEDYNAYQQEGFSPMQMTIENGIRCSTYQAYLKPALKRKNLMVITKALVNKVLIKDKTAIGIECIYNKKVIQYFAKKEIILSAGPINSPAILQRSGIGDQTTLNKAKVTLIHELPGVGKNLQDHLEVYFQYQCKQPVTLNSKLNRLNKLLIGIQWLLSKNGLGASNHFEACAFIRSKSGLIAPDIQYHFLPAAIRYDGKQAFKGDGFQVHVGPNKPKSSGTVTITSSNANIAPNIQFNYLKEDQDIIDWRTCIHLTSEILLQPALDLYRGKIIQPDIDLSSDQSIDQWVRENAESAYHPCGTCKMGDVDDPLAVVDSACKVIGINKLRVVDSSIFPVITNGNLNAPTIMVAEKVSDLILGYKPLEEINAKVWCPPNWQLSQRPNKPIRASAFAFNKAKATKDLIA